MTVWVFGDSLSTGHGLETDGNSWPNLLAKSIGVDCVNFARPAADNLYIYYSYLYQLSNIQANDIVVVGWTHPSRKSFVFDEHNIGQVNSIEKSFIFDATDIKFIRSRNQGADTISKWLNFKPENKGNPYYDTWFNHYYSEIEQKINLTAYHSSVKATCPGTFVPFFFSKQSVSGLNLVGAGYAVDFIVGNNCAISEQDAHFSIHGHSLWVDLLHQFISNQHHQSMFPIIELVDRLSIAEVKWERTKANQEELAWYKKQIHKVDILKITSMMEQLKQIHRDIWDKEALLKSGKEQELSMDEIGCRAIAIRDLNNQRVALKNSMAEKLACPVREIKKDHLSE